MQIIIEYSLESVKSKVRNFTNLPINIGSAPTNDLIIEEYDNVSPHHSVIVVHNERIALYNHSKLGTFINGKSINKVFLPDSCHIQLGKDGPLLCIKIIKNEENTIEERLSNKIEKQRWYDRDVLVSKAMHLLENSNDEKVTKVAQTLVIMLNKQNPDDIFVKPYVNIQEEIKKLPRNTRWYDLNKCLQKIVEGLMLCKPEVKEKLSLQIIVMLDNIDEINKNNDLPYVEVLNETLILAKCPQCNNDITINSKYCACCGSKVILESEKNELIKCPECKTEVNKESHFCFNCGYNMKEISIISKDLLKRENDDQLNIKSCPYCSEEIPTNSIICPFCDESLKQNINSIIVAQTNCPICDEFIDQNSKSCPYCNELLVVQEDPKPLNKCKRSVFVVVILSIITLGLYYPIWFLNRKEVFNSLKSVTKLGSSVLVTSLLLYLVAIIFGLSSLFIEYGTYQYKLFTALDKILSLLGFIFMLFPLYQAREILKEHYNVFGNAHIKINPVLTFFFTFFYLQFKINRL